MGYSLKELRALARKKKIRHYHVKNKDELCRALEIEHDPFLLRKITPVTIRCVEKDETTDPASANDLRESVHQREVDLLHFPSISALAKAMGKNIGSVVWYEKTKRPISVETDVSQGVIPPGKYVIDRVTK